VRVDREVRVVVLADELLQRDAVAAVDVDRDRRAAAGVGEHPAVEDEERRAVGAGGEGRRGSDGEDRDGEKSAEQDLLSHGTTPCQERDTRIVGSPCQAPITAS